MNGKFPEKCVDSKFTICLRRASTVSYSFYIGPDWSDHAPAEMVAIVAFATGKIQYRELYNAVYVRMYVLRMYVYTRMRGTVVS